MLYHDIDIKIIYQKFDTFGKVLLIENYRKIPLIFNLNSLINYSNCGLISAKAN